MSSHPQKNTRHAILDILKREGPTEARALAKRLGITPMAISLQLASLEEEKIVTSGPAMGPETIEQAPRRGRPVRNWSLTEAANRAFPDAHALLTVGLLTSLQEVYGSKGLEKLLEARTRSQIEEYARILPADASLREKIKALASARDREGYMTEVKSGTGGAILFIENHCPICTAAKSCQGFCQSEWKVFQTVLGPEAKVTREEHLLSGDRRCVYAIRGTADPS